MKIIIPRSPFIEHGLRGRLAVYKNKDRVFFRGIKIRRLHHPAVQRDAVANIELEEFGGSVEKHGCIGAKIGIIFQYPRGTMGGKLYKIGDRCNVSTGIDVYKRQGQAAG